MSGMHASVSTTPVYQSDGGTSVYEDRTFHCNGIMLLPGHYVVTREAVVLVTVLGSCISACIRDPVAGIAGMNHFMLPNGQVTASSAPARYGSYAMEVLINEMLKAGAERHRLEAKLFGGARIITSIMGSSVGERNAVFARRYLVAEGIRLISSDVLGFHGRKVYFFADSGKVKVKSLAQTDAALAEEERYTRTVNVRPRQNNVELF